MGEGKKYYIIASWTSEVSTVPSEMSIVLWEEEGGGREVLVLSCVRRLLLFKIRGEKKEGNKLLALGHDGATWLMVLVLFIHAIFSSSSSLQKDEPPEITYCVVNQNGMMHLQTLSPAQPMPEESELDAKFTELLVSLFSLS